MRQRLEVAASTTGAAATTAGGAATTAAAAGATTTAGATATTTAGTGATGTGSGIIGVTLNGLNDYAKQLATGVYEAFKGTGYSIEVVSDDYDAGKELTNAEALLSKGAVGLVSLPVTAESAASAAQAASGKSVPFGNALWPGTSDADKYFTTVAALDSVEGRHADRRVPQGEAPQRRQDRRRPGHRRPGLLRAASTRASTRRIAGSDIEVVAREQGFFDRTKAVGVVETAFQANPDIAGSSSPTPRRCPTASPSG